MKLKLGGDELVYQGNHRPPRAEGGAPLHDLTQVYPDDVYSAAAPRYYGTGNPKEDAAVFQRLWRLRGKPQAEMTIYRAVPRGAPAKKINKGDWVTPSRQYAMQHGLRFEEGYRILKRTVRAGEVFTNGDSILEAGYWPFEGGVPARWVERGSSMEGLRPDLRKPLMGRKAAEKLWRASSRTAELARANAAARVGVAARGDTTPADTGKRRRGPTPEFRRLQREYEEAKRAWSKKDGDTLGEFGVPPKPRPWDHGDPEVDFSFTIGCEKGYRGKDKLRMREDLGARPRPACGVIHVGAVWAQPPGKPWQKYYSVAWVRVVDGAQGKGLATKLYEAAAQEACKRGAPLASDSVRFPGSDGFWRKQLRKGRARDVFDKRGQQRFALSCPAPSSLAGLRKRRNT
jgi:GNAT superfamily N-acetyltransferase